MAWDSEVVLMLLVLVVFADSCYEIEVQSEYTEGLRMRISMGEVGK